MSVKEIESLIDRLSDQEFEDLMFVILSKTRRLLSPEEVEVMNRERDSLKRFVSENWINSNR